jgi:4-hydroxyphenylacetate 3-monooxygenase
MGGQCIDDVTTHPAFRNAPSAACLYDFLGQHVEQMTGAPPDTGGRVSRCWQLPGNYAELVGRWEALAAWAPARFGFMGRAPDQWQHAFPACTWGSTCSRPPIPRASALRDYYWFARDGHRSIAMTSWSRIEGTVTVT